jgi:hypothetical protein
MWDLRHATSIGGGFSRSTYQRQNATLGRGKPKKAGPKGPASQTGRLHVWETWDHKDPEFQRDQSKPFVSKT